VVAAGLVGRSFVKLGQVPLGFSSDRLLTVRMTPKGERYKETPRVSAFYQQVLERVRSAPGVASAGAITIRPLWSTVGYDSPFTVEGQSELDARRNPHLNFMAVSADYFRTMGIPLRRGRVFTDRDATGQPGVVVVGESLAARVWPGENALGKRLKVPMTGTQYQNSWFTVVGVVADGRYRELQATRLDIYLSHLQADTPLGYLVVRATGEPTALSSSIRAIVRSLDDTVAITEIASMDQIVSQALGNPRFAAIVFGMFGLVALALAALGVYGLLAYAVTCRTQEIGVRMALGARVADVLGAVLGSTIRLTLAGLAIGLVSAALLARLVEGLLFGVRPSDPITFAMAPVVLALAALVACLAPALRAVRVDPLVALRYE
jgi:predicted permease